MSGEHVEQTVREDHCSLAAVLRRAHLDRTGTTALRLTANVQRSREEIDVADLRPRGLPEPQTGESRKSHEGFEPWRSGGDDGRDLVSGQTGTCTDATGGR